MSDIVDKAANPDPSLDVWIPNADAARDAVSFQNQMHAQATRQGLTSIQFIIPEDSRKQIDAILAGKINTGQLKFYRKYIKTEPGNALFLLPRWCPETIPLNLPPLRRAGLPVPSMDGELEKEFEPLCKPSLSPPSVMTAVLPPPPSLPSPARRGRPARPAPTAPTA